MKSRMIILFAAVLTVAVTIFVQLGSENGSYRIHQHKTEAVTDEDIESPLSCITPTSASSYDAGAVDVSKLKTHLPIVILDTDEEIPGARESGNIVTYTESASGEDYINAKMKVIDNNGTYNTPEDQPAVNSLIEISVHGNTSRSFDKKSYTVNLVDPVGNERDEAIMGMGEHHEWILNGPFLDKTLMRNYMSMNLSGEIMDYAPNVRFCEVIKNGAYQGLYVMMETVSRGPERIDIEKPSNTKNVTGYIIELDKNVVFPATAMNNFTKYTAVLRKGAYFNIIYPGKRKLTPEIKEYVEKDVSKFEKALYSYDYDTAQYGFQNYVDVEEFTDYFILMEVFLQHDTGNLSTYFYKDVNGLYKPCVWDFNNDLENVSTIGEDDFAIRHFCTVQAPWFLMMVKEKSFTDGIIARYHELRKGVLSDEYLDQYIDDTRNYLGSAIDRNYAVWGYSFDVNNVDFRNKLHPDERNPLSYDDAVQQMKDTLHQRLLWLDENIEILTQYSHESAVKKFNH